MAVQSRTTEQVAKLAADHWRYTENAITAALKYAGTSEEEITRLTKTIGFFYNAATIHGYKHAVEDSNTITGIRECRAPCQHNNSGHCTIHKGVTINILGTCSAFSPKMSRNQGENSQ